MKRVSLEQLKKQAHISSYDELYAYVLRQIADDMLRPVRASGRNGKKPALYLAYWIVGEKPDYGKLLDELRYRIGPRLQVDYYLRHPDVYETDRADVLRLDAYFREHSERLNRPESVNERSFEIWGREKFLKTGEGGKILKRVGIPRESLNLYETSEPLPCFSQHKCTPQNMLILENKDTFYSMRRHLLEGHETILGRPFGTLLYGAGKKVIRGFQDFELFAEPYMRQPGNQLFYFGDLDYEGILIYESLCRSVDGKLRIILFREAYLAMLEKQLQMGLAVTDLPLTKEGQNRNGGESFFQNFSHSERDAMREILSKNRYIPQEILTMEDYE